MRVDFIIKKLLYYKENEGSKNLSKCKNSKRLVQYFVSKILNITIIDVRNT